MAELIRKFNISSYSSLTTYAKYDVVKHVVSDKEYYFVSVHGGHSGQLNTSTLISNTYWKRFDDTNVAFSDIWRPSFSTSVNAETRVRDGTVEDGVTKITPDGINTSTLSFSLVFDNLEDVEAKSLLCYLDFMGGKRAFRWFVPSPYDQLLTFTFTSAKHAFNKKNDSSITVTIEQSFMIFGVGAGQQGTGIFNV